MPKLFFTVTNDLTYDQRMIRICSSLAAAGYTVRLIGREKRGSRPLSDRPFQQVRIRCFWEKGKLFYLEYNLRLFFYLLRTSFDAVCSIDLDTLLPGFGAARIKGKPLIYDAHEYFTEVPELVDRPFTKRIWESLAQGIVPRIRHAYTVGPELAQLFEQRYGTAFSVIRNLPLSRKAIDTLPEGSPRIILYQGALNVGRGLEEAILAMKDVNGAEFWMAGEGDLSEKLRKLVRRKKLDHKVKFLGFVLPEDLPKLTQRATIGLNLLQNRGLNYYYSLANKTFDYIQAGIPSLNPAFPEYIRLQKEFDCLILVDELTPRAIASSLNALLQDPDRLAAIREKCRWAAEQLCWEKEEQKLIRFYAEVFRT
jgi:glycosyltransferase involved in cell wall biosynthesis